MMNKAQWRQVIDPTIGEGGHHLDVMLYFLENYVVALIYRQRMSVSLGISCRVDRSLCRLKDVILLHRHLSHISILETDIKNSHV